MTHEDHEQLIEAIKSEIHAELKAANGSKTWWFRASITVVQVVLAAALGLMVHWANSINHELHVLQEWRAGTEAWIQQVPRYTAANAEVTKMQAVKEATDAVTTMMGRLEGKVEMLQNEMRSQGTQVAMLNALLRKEQP